MRSKFGQSLLTIWQTHLQQTICHPSSPEYRLNCHFSAARTEWIEDRRAEYTYLKHII